MQEILPGVWHWTAPNPNIGGKLVSSYWLDDGGVLIDPLVPEPDGLEFFAQRTIAPRAIVLSNRHHYRDSARFQERFGCPVHVPATGLHNFGEDRPVLGYAYGEDLPGGLLAVEVGVISPDDSGLYLAGARALWLADTIVCGFDEGNRIGFVIDQLMDDPPATKRGLLEAFTRLLSEFEFDSLLLAHGPPQIGTGRAELEAFIQAGGRTASEAFAG